MRSGFAWLSALFVLAPAGSALGAPPDRAACVAAYEAAQVSMNRARLLQARKQLRQCLDPACPEKLRPDCSQWLEETEARIPTVLLAFRRADGTPIVKAKVLIDGEPL